MNKIQRRSTVAEKGRKWGGGGEKQNIKKKLRKRDEKETSIKEISFLKQGICAKTISFLFFFDDVGSFLPPRGK